MQPLLYFWRPAKKASSKVHEVSRKIGKIYLNWIVVGAKRFFNKNIKIFGKHIDKLPLRDWKAHFKLLITTQ